MNAESMVALFITSEWDTFGEGNDRVHLFPDEQAALRWVAEQLVAMGYAERGDDGYLVTERGEYSEHGDNQSASYGGLLAEYQMTLSMTEYCHFYPIIKHEGDDGKTS